MIAMETGFVHPRMVSSASMCSLEGSASVAMVFDTKRIFGYSFTLKKFFPLASLSLSPFPVSTLAESISKLREASAKLSVGIFRSASQERNTPTVLPNVELLWNSIRLCSFTTVLVGALCGGAGEENAAKNKSMGAASSRIKETPRKKDSTSGAAQKSLRVARTVPDARAGG